MAGRYADSGVIVIPERLDVGTSADIRRLLHEAVDHCVGDLRIDVADLEVIDAAGLGVLVGTRRRADLVGVRVVLIDVPPRLHRLLAVTRLSRLFHYESVLLPADSVVIA
jgi:anti-sigma B factor antagonist